MKRTPEQWARLLQERKARLADLLALHGPAIVIATECLMVVEAHYRSRYGWLWKTFTSQLWADFQNWKINRRFKRTKAHELTDEEIAEMYTIVKDDEKWTPRG